MKKTQFVHQLDLPSSQPFFTQLAARNKSPAVVPAFLSGNWF
jgi:hypothetical protein